MMQNCLWRGKKCLEGRKAYSGHQFHPDGKTLSPKLLKLYSCSAAGLYEAEQSGLSLLGYSNSVPSSCNSLSEKFKGHLNLTQRITHCFCPASLTLLWCVVYPPPAVPGFPERLQQQCNCWYQPVSCSRSCQGKSLLGGETCQRDRAQFHAAVYARHLWSVMTGIMWYNTTPCTSACLLGAAAYHCLPPPRSSRTN